MLRICTQIPQYHQPRRIILRSMFDTLQLCNLQPYMAQASGHRERSILIPTPPQIHTKTKHARLAKTSMPTPPPRQEPHTERSLLPKHIMCRLSDLHLSHRSHRTRDITAKTRARAIWVTQCAHLFHMFRRRRRCVHLRHCA